MEDPMPIQRRTLIQGALGGAAIAGPFQGLVASPAEALVAAKGKPPTTLIPIPDLRDDVVRLHLPKGFSYRSFHDTSSPVVHPDGTVMPGRHDGMGAFAGSDGGVVLIRNHEINGPVGAFSSTAPVYDPMAGGGTTTVNVSSQGVVSSWKASLAGTQNNCSGGRMPWGAWVTCEETVNGPDVGPDFTGASNIALTQPHGFVFEVPVDGTASAQPITKAGRFSHEAVSFDPREGRLYLTEDNFAFPSGFYRYTPTENPMNTGSIGNDGTLEMLKVVGVDQAHLEAQQDQGATYDVEWVPIEDPDPSFPYTPGITAPTTNDQALNYVGDQGRALGAAHFSRNEGQVFHDGVVYFTSTQAGGPAETGPELVNGYGNGFGQVWAYNTRNQRLTCVYQSPERDVLEFPDNITTSARGTLVICADHDQDNYIRGLTPKGKLWNIALNRIAGRTGDEFAGSTFSPDGGTLFVNIQASRGMTFAIWGPWESLGV
jgi:secreted PhoX family phosphatase